MNDNANRYFIAISLIKGLGHINAKKLIAACGGVEAVFQESKSLLSKLKIGRHILNQIKSGELFVMVDKELRYVDENNIQVIHFFNKTYPFRLKQCEDAPLVIYTKGNINYNPDRSLAIVGTRRSGKYGIETCAKIIDGLRNSNVQVISGLADGIDTAAHEGAINNGLNTVAVLGHGLNRIYPYNNRNLSERIISSGGLLTDFPTSASMVPGNFPSRNRLIAGLSDATLVVESGKKGGSLITADLALSYNRDVFAVPGRSNDINSAGCNQLIKEMKAALVENADDIIKCLDWTDVQMAQSQQKLFHDFTQEEIHVIDLLKDMDAVKIDDISINCNLSLNKTASILLNLEFKNAVKSLPGKMYSLIA